MPFLAAAPLALPLMVAVTRVPTAVVLTANVPDVLPVGTRAETGTIADLLLLDSVTLKPPAGAGPLRTMVPVEGFPPTTVLGLKVIVETCGGVTVKVAVATFVPWVAVTTAEI